MFDKIKQMGGQLGDLAKMQAQAMQIKKQLEQEMIVVEEQGVRVVIAGDQQVKELSVQGISNNVLLEVLNKAIKKSQEIAAQKLYQLSGGLGGMLGK